MPFPLLPALAGIGSAIAAGAGAYNLGTNIKDRNARKKLEKQAQSNAAKNAKKAKNKNVVAPEQEQPGSQLTSTPTGPNSLKEQLLGTQNRVQQIANRTPEQMAAQSAILQNALKGLQSNQFDFAPIEKSALENYQREVIPSIMERYKGGALNRALASSGKDLQTQLAVLKQQHALGQQGMNQNLLKLGLAPQFENAFIGGDQGFLGGFSDLLKDPASYQALLGKLSEMYKSYQSRNQDQDQSGQSQNQQGAGGDFAYNPQLNDFANQGTRYNVEQYLQGRLGGDMLNKNQVGMDLQYPQSKYQQVSPDIVNYDNAQIGLKNPNLDALKLLYPNKSF